MQPSWSLIEPLAIAGSIALFAACLAPSWGRPPAEPELDEISYGWTRKGMSMSVRSTALTPRNG